MFQIGDRVTHSQYGNGVVEILVSHQFAYVRFGKYLECVEQRNIKDVREERNMSARARQAKARRKEQSRREAVQRQEAEREHLRQEELRKQHEAKCANLLEDIRNYLRDDFLGAQAYFRDTCTEFVSEAAFEHEKIIFVRSWFSQYISASETSAKILPDDKQLTAIATVNGHVQVVARAGSGKTKTLVNRAFFLLKHCRVAPHQMILLAFNKKAASEVRRRLLSLLHEDSENEVSNEIERIRNNPHGRSRVDKSQIEVDAVDAIAKQLNITLPYVMTFHALAYAVVHPEENIISDGVDGSDQKLNQVVQRLIDDNLQRPAFKARIRKLMLAHFREDWERIVDGRYDQSKSEFLRFRRSLRTESINGDYIKSYGEKVIANFLFEHGIQYKYEQNFWWNGINYRPDFTLPQTLKSGVIIEYFGLKGEADYDEMSEQKRNYWKAKGGWTLVEFSPSDVVQDSFKERLNACLEEHDIPCTQLSEDEIWHQIKGRAIDRFTTAMTGFINRCRIKSLSPQALRSLIDNYSPLSPIENMFLDIAHDLYAAYLERLFATGEDDFNGLMQRATAVIATGQTSFKRKSGSGDLAALHYIFIDEFQDFSDLFYRFLTAVRKQNPSVELFCVGDDWQAINGFAGSDLRFFSEFESHIGKAHRLNISTNYRSCRAIVSIGNALMNGRGKPAIAHKDAPGSVFVSSFNEFEPLLAEKERHPNDKITPAILRVVNKALTDEMDVVMLSRTNRFRGQKLDKFLVSIRSFFPKGIQERVTVSTAHQYKGLEKSMVIVLDAGVRSYPLIHPNWVFSRILGESLGKIIEEERRLLYVALTRAVQTLVIFTDEQQKSPFLKELDGQQVVRSIDWDEFPPPARDSSIRLVVQVGNQESHGSRPTYTIKDSLRAAGYQWQSKKSWAHGRKELGAWAKSFPVKEFNLEILKSEVWANGVDGIDVRVYDEAESSVVAQYLVNDGTWHCQIDKLDALCNKN